MADKIYDLYEEDGLGEAVKYGLEQIKNHPDSDILFYEIGNIYYESGMFNEA